MGGGHVLRALCVGRALSHPETGCHQGGSISLSTRDVEVRDLFSPFWRIPHGGKSQWSTTRAANLVLQSTLPLILPQPSTVDAVTGRSSWRLLRARASAWLCAASITATGPLGPSRLFAQRSDLSGSAGNALPTSPPQIELAPFSMVRTIRTIPWIRTMPTYERRYRRRFSGTTCRCPLAWLLDCLLLL